MKKNSFFTGMFFGILFTGIISFTLFTFYNFSQTRSGQQALTKSLAELVEKENLEGVKEEANLEKEQDISISEFEDKVDEIDQVLGDMYYETIDQNSLWESAYEGYVAGIGDPYTSYFTAEQFQSFMEDTSGSYEGIGVVVGFSESGENVQVVAPFEGSPGEKAGILPDDIILKVNDIDIAGFTLEEVVKEIKGPKGTDVVLNIYRQSSGKMLDITITRDIIDNQTVSYELFSGGIGYIKVTGFQEVTYDQFIAALKDLETQEMKGLIIDLRNNPGGLVNIVAAMADEILPEGLIVYTEDKNGNRKEIESDEKHRFDKPLVVLVNGNSASASEIFAGAVKDHERGTIVGTTTFGKGLVQTTVQLEDGSAIKVTIARYFTPDGYFIHKVGIEPNVVVELPEEFKDKYIVDRENDTQLDKAIEVIQGQIK